MEMVETGNSRSPPPVDTGLISLVLLARFLGVAADPEQLRHTQAVSARDRFGSVEILRTAKSLGLKAREIESDWSRLAITAMPAIALLRDGTFWLIGAQTGDKLLVQNPAESAPSALARDEFAAIWTGRLILITKRNRLPGVSGRFDFSWFIPSLIKYRNLFGEVLVASFGIQLLALASPIFFRLSSTRFSFTRG